MKQKKDLWRNFLRRPESLTLVALLGLLVFNLFFTKGFFTIQIRDGHLYGSLIDIVKRGVPLMITVMGLTMVIATGGTDISVGSIAAIAGVVTATLIGGDFAFETGAVTASRVPIGIAVAAGLLVAAVIGLWNGFLVERIGIPPLIATLMMQVAGRGIAELIASGKILTIYYKPFYYIGSGWFLGLPVSIFLVAVLGILIWLLLRKTAYGLYLTAIGLNKTATAFSGIKTRAVVWSAFVFSALMAGMAGIVTASEIRAADPVNLGLYLELDAILACNLGGNSMKGGRCNLAGSIIGAVLVQTLTTTIFSKGVPSETILVYKAIVVILVGMIQVTNWDLVLKRRGKKREAV